MTSNKRFESPSTIFDIIWSIILDTPGSTESFPLYEIITEPSDDEICQLTDPFFSYPTSRRVRYLLCIRRFTELLECVHPCIFADIHTDPYLGCGYGQLEKAIAERSLDQINHILPKKQHLVEHSNRTPNGMLSPLELALGWPSGLEKLSKAGFDVLHALRLSVHMGDLASTRTLQATYNKPYQPHPYLPKP